MTTLTELKDWLLGEVETDHMSAEDAYEEYEEAVARSIDGIHLRGQ